MKRGFFIPFIHSPKRLTSPKPACIWWFPYPLSLLNNFEKCRPKPGLFYPLSVLIFRKSAKKLSIKKASMKEAFLNVIKISDYNLVRRI